MTEPTDLTTIIEQRCETSRALHAAGQAGDFDTVLAAYDPDVVWVNGEGAGPWAGRFDGLDAVAAMFVGFTTFFEDTFTQELVDACASADRSVLVMIERGDKDGHHFENRAAWVNRYEGDRIVEVTTHDLDGAAARAFWDAVGPA